MEEDNKNKEPLNSLSLSQQNESGIRAIERFSIDDGNGSSVSDKFSIDKKRKRKIYLLLLVGSLLTGLVIYIVLRQYGHDIDHDQMNYIITQIISLLAEMNGVEGIMGADAQKHNIPIALAIDGVGKASPDEHIIGKIEKIRQNLNEAIRHKSKAFNST